jgi:hypothetical protein
VSLRRLLDGLPELCLDGDLLPAVGGLGDRFLHEIRAGDIRALGEEIRGRVGRERVADSLCCGRPLASYRADGHGHGAQRTFLEVSKRCFAEAIDDGLTARNPAAKLPKPTRQRLVRPLTVTEEQDLRTWIH